MSEVAVALRTEGLADSPDSMAEKLSPVSAADRLEIIDIVRGVALLGILTMNIVGLALIPAAYELPTVAGGSTGWNLWAWFLNEVVFEGKMRGIFSMVFGAGIVLFTTRAERKHAAADAADFYMRRTIWLLLFGMAHAFFFWFGDILFPYALCGLFLYPFRRLSARGLLIFGTVFLLGYTVVAGLKAWDFVQLRDTVTKAAITQKAGGKLTDEETEAQRKWADMMQFMNPDEATKKKIEEDFRGDFVSATKRRIAIVMFWHALPIYDPGLWDMFGMMLLGMAFLKLGILSGERSNAFFWKLMLVSYAVGLPLQIWLAWRDAEANFDLTAFTFSGIGYQPARIAVTFGHIALIVLLVKSGAMRWLTKRLSAVGQMAFTNYIMHSVICSLLFCGYGLGLYNQMERYQLWYVVIGVWVLQLIYSPIWLRHYRFGPLEWCWRALTYWKRPAFRRVPGTELIPVGGNPGGAQAGVP